ncbi:MAG: site-2 protease family protein, partial [Phycisphaerae bacterium]|nr:site-2 protease family protein [Phycisphaerae bacterium]
GAEITAINNQKVHSWLDIVATLKKLAGQKVTLQGRVGTEEKTWDIGSLDKAVFNPDDYKWSLLSDVPFQPETVVILYRNPLKAIAWGAAETGRLVVLVYKSFGAMIRGSVSATKAVQGPIGIGSLAVSAAREDFMSLVRLMAFLSVALAVFNFLPIPVLDGGHALLLVIEKIRGKALPLKFVNALQMVFLVLILGLFLVISWNDVLRIVRGLW